MSDNLVAFLHARWAEQSDMWTACLPQTSYAARVLADIEIDRELLRKYEQLLRAHERHTEALVELAADIEQADRVGKWEGVGNPNVRQQALRREADYLPAMLRLLETWAKAKAAVHADHPDYRAACRP